MRSRSIRCPVKCSTVWTIASRYDSVTSASTPSISKTINPSISLIAHHATCRLCAPQAFQLGEEALDLRPGADGDAHTSGDFVAAITYQDAAFSKRIADGDRAVAGLE